MKVSPQVTGIRSASLFGVAVVSCIAFAGAGCAAAAPRAKATPAANGGATTRPFITPPIVSDSFDPRNDAVVRIVGGVSCSGTLIADDLVLTAHHCVSMRDARGHAVAEDVAADTLHVEIGQDDFPYAEAGVKAIVSPRCGYDQGKGDIAILVLARKLVGVPIWPPRVDAPVKVGEPADTAGFGRCASIAEPIKLHGHPGERVSSVTRDELVARAGICPGDSGGPVFDSADAKREVVGVISASVMDNVGSPGTSYFTRLDVWPQLFSAAREIADGASPSELPPFRSCDAAPSGD